MKKNSIKPIHSSYAYLLNKIDRFPGTLELWATVVCFRFKNFNESHLNLNIPIAEIEKIEEFLVFDIAKIGLRIQGLNGKNDLFVLEDGGVFKKKIQAQVRKNSMAV